MFNMGEREPITGWESVTPNPHPINRLYALSLSAWKLASKWADDGRDWDDIKKMQDAAIELEKLARAGEDCNCTPRDDSCPICRVVARVVYAEE